MGKTKRTNLSLALFVLICFFLPWVQVSCLGAKDSVSGFELAREGDRVLWLVPLLMLTVLALGLAPAISERTPALSALSGMVGGGLSAWLMGHEHGEVGSSGLVATFWTAWYWLGLVASLGVAVTALWFYARRVRAP
ncbi:MAG: hypothetical protein HYR56_23040 [Acidobacteria bacterium]|nr:hypothetical protein [Acidobacteriota bacterium]MBI3427853.1 hypothetical protein [Acidobacteriota bacterium]